jgi:hypothetical protein
MSINDFLSQGNIKLIWEIIIDEGVLTNKSKHTINKIVEIFNKIIKEFYEKEKNNYTSLTDINKKYIVFIINYINKIFPNKSNINKDNSINNVNNVKENNTLITAEEIKNNNLAIFEKQLIEKQNEFISTIQTKTPPTLDFSDKKDSPLENHEKLIEETIYKRNLETQQYQNNLLKQQQFEKWLKSNDNTEPRNSIKYIKIGENIDNSTNLQNTIIDLSKEKTNLPKPILKKQITWQNDETIYEIKNEDKNDTPTIFSKLKVIDKNLNENNENKENKELNLIKEEISDLHNKINKLDNNINIILNLLQIKNKTNEINENNEINKTNEINEINKTNEINEINKTNEINEINVNDKTDKN